MVIKFDKLKNLDVRNTCDILWKYCNLQMTNASVASASVGFEQLSDQHVQKMAPKKTAPKKVAEETAPKKVAKETAPKKVAEETAPKKVAEETATKKVAKEAPAGKEPVDSSSDLINLLLPTELLLLVSQVLGSSSLLTFVELLLTFQSRSSPSATTGLIWALQWLSARDGLRFVTFILISNPLVIIFIFITLNIVMRIKERENSSLSRWSPLPSQRRST